MSITLKIINSTALVITGTEIEKKRSNYSSLLNQKKYGSLCKDIGITYLESVWKTVFLPMAYGMDAYNNMMTSLARKIQGK